jgi:hypothetical protein
MPKECFCFNFCFGTACGAIMFAVAIGTTISCSLARQYRPVFSLSFLDVYETFRHFVFTNPNMQEPLTQSQYGFAFIKKDLNREEIK